ncbi:hypothetical protein LEMLEM_LOCUS19717 [Lemmus lemmus]
MNLRRTVTSTCLCSSFLAEKRVFVLDPALSMWLNNVLLPTSTTEPHQEAELSRCLVALKKGVMPIILWPSLYSNQSKRISHWVVKHKLLESPLGPG